MKVIDVAKRNERMILTVVGISTELLAVGEAMVEGPKFKRLADEMKETKEKGEEINKKDIALRALPSVLKIAIPLGISITAQVLNQKKATDTIQSLTSLLMLAREGKAALKEQMVIEMGQEKADAVEDKATKAKIDRDFSDASVGARPYVIETGHGMTKFYDDFSGRYFYSDANYIDKTINKLNAVLIEAADHRGGVLLNELYEELGLPAIDAGDDRMWTFDSGLIAHRIASGIDEANQLYGILYFTNKPEKVVSWY